MIDWEDIKCGDDVYRHDSVYKCNDQTIFWDARQEDAVVKQLDSMVEQTRYRNELLECRVCSTKFKRKDMLRHHKYVITCSEFCYRSLFIECDCCGSKTFGGGLCVICRCQKTDIPLEFCQLVVQRSTNIWTENGIEDPNNDNLWMVVSHAGLSSVSVPPWNFMNWFVVRQSKSHEYLNYPPSRVKRHSYYRDWIVVPVVPHSGKWKRSTSQVYPSIKSIQEVKLET